MSHDTVGQLLVKVSAGDRWAFHALYCSTSPQLFGVLVRMLRDHAEAEDALQEVYLRTWLRAGQFNSAKGQGMGWLISLSRNLAIDRLRARRDAFICNGVAIDAIPAQGRTIEARVMAGSDVRRACICFSTLKPQTAAAIQWAYLYGLSYAEIAERQNVPINTMRTRLRRGLLKLKKCLEA